MRPKIILLGSFFINLYISGQDSLPKNNALVKSIVVGTSLTYIPDIETINGIDQPGKYGYHEFTWATNIAADFSKYYRTGIDLKLIYTRSTLTGNNRYYMIGWFNRFKFYQSKNLIAFASVGPYFGNYCTCGADNPYRVDKLAYINYGPGLSVKLNNYFWANFEFTNANIITKIPARYNYTQYIIGLNYVISTKK
jgi:hypothetical protein